MNDRPVARSVNGVPIRLTAERWQHIGRRHPEVALMQAKIRRAVAEPEAVHQGHAGTLLAVDRAADDLYLVVVYRETGVEDGFVITAYLARRLPSGRLIWKR